jgi:hypothetical protein
VPYLLQPFRKLDKIFGEAQPRFLIDRISGFVRLLVTLVRLFPKLSRIDLCHQSQRNQVCLVAKRCRIFPVYEFALG